MKDFDLTIGDMRLSPGPAGFNLSNRASNWPLSLTQLRDLIMMCSLLEELDRK